MAASFVQDTSASPATTGFVNTTAFGANTTSGNTIIVFVMNIQEDTYFVKDSVGNYYTQITNTAAFGLASVAQATAYINNNIVGGSSVTINVRRSGSSNMSIIAQEWSGIANDFPVDVSANNVRPFTANPQSGAVITTTNANDLLVSGASCESSNISTSQIYSAGSGWSNFDAALKTGLGGTCVMMQSQVVSSTGTYTPTYNSTLSNPDGDTAITVALKGSSPAFVQSMHGSNSISGQSSYQTGAFGSSTTTGNTILIFLNNNSGYTTSITDTAGNVYQRINGNVSGSFAHGMMYYANNITGGASQKLTINGSSPTIGATWVVQEFSGVSTVTAIDTFATTVANTLANGSNNGAAITTTNASDAVIASFADITSGNPGGNFWSLGSGFTNLTTAFNNGGNNITMEGETVSATGTYTPTISSSFADTTKYGAITVALKQAVIDTGRPAPPIRIPTRLVGPQALRYAFRQPYTPISEFHSLNFLQTGIARLANNRTLTQTAIARIALNKTLTQSAIARTAIIGTKTQTGTANIIIPIAPVLMQIPNKYVGPQALRNAFRRSYWGQGAFNASITQSAISRIANNFTKTQSSVARIANNFTKTQNSVARIANNLTKTQSAIARIANNINKTQTAIARVANNLTKTQSAIARIQNSLTKTQSAIARIATNNTKTQNAIARIQTNLTKTQGATARIDLPETKIQTGIARIANNLTKTQSAIARIATNLAFTQTATARIDLPETKTQTAKARIAISSTFTQTSTARIKVILSFTQNSSAHIVNNNAVNSGFFRLF